MKRLPTPEGVKVMDELGLRLPAVVRHFMGESMDPCTRNRPADQIDYAIVIVDAAWRPLPRRVN